MIETGAVAAVDADIDRIIATLSVRLTDADLYRRMRFAHNP